MHDELQPVQEDEFVLRRIHRSAFKAELSPPVLRIAFQPNENDDTGLSVYRERCVSAAATLANVDPGKRDAYYVARLAVRDLVRLGLSVVPEPDPNGPPGPTVLREVRWRV